MEARPVAVVVGWGDSLHAHRLQMLTEGIGNTDAIGSHMFGRVSAPVGAACGSLRVADQRTGTRRPFDPASHGLRH